MAIDDDKQLCDLHKLHEMRLTELENVKEKIAEKQQEILETLNNGLKSQTKENGRRLNKMEANFNKLMFALGGGMFSIILLLVSILVKINS